MNLSLPLYLQVFVAGMVIECAFAFVQCILELGNEYLNIMIGVE